MHARDLENVHIFEKKKNYKWPLFLNVYDFGETKCGCSVDVEKIEQQKEIWYDI